MKNMIKLVSIFLLFISFSFSLNVTNDFLEEIQKEIKKGINEVHNGRYDKTLEIFDKIILRLPNHPLGYFLYSAALNRMMVDYSNFGFEDIFLERVNQAIKLSKKMILEDKNNPWGYFYLGGAYGFRGIFYSETVSVSRAFPDGFRGYNKMKHVLKLDDSIYDAYYGVGLFHYWINFYKVAWLFAIKADKQQGIEEVKIASEKGFYSDVEAASSLIRVYYNEKEYDKALTQAKSVVKKYPNYLYCYWYIAFCHAELNNLKEELETYMWLKSYFEQSTLSSQTALMRVNYYIGNTYKKQGNIQKAKEHLGKVIEIEKGIKESRNEGDEKMNRVRKYKNLATKLLIVIKREERNNL